MSQITDDILRYRKGELSFDRLVHALVSFPYKVPTYQRRKPENYLDQIEDMELHSTLEEGTWGEVDAAWCHDLHTDDELRAIRQAIVDHFGPQGTVGKQRPEAEDQEGAK